jgi:murein DD-endopeptidase MepM/ murein hydrolase activator NlpD
MSEVETAVQCTTSVEFGFATSDGRQQFMRSSKSTLNLELDTAYVEDYIKDWGPMILAAVRRGKTSFPLTNNYAIHVDESGCIIHAGKKVEGSYELEFSVELLDHNELSVFKNIHAATLQRVQLERRQQREQQQQQEQQQREQQREQQKLQQRQQECEQQEPQQQQQQQESAPQQQQSAVMTHDEALHFKMNLNARDKERFKSNKSKLKTTIGRTPTLVEAVASFNNRRDYDSTERVANAEARAAARAGTTNKRK